MQLYHYSKELYPELKTLEMQRSITKDEIKNYESFKTPLSPSKPYWKHISFFFDPIPIDKIGVWYGKGHRIWYSGNRLYEYTVNAKDLGRFSYEIVEPPEKTAILFDDTIPTEVYYSRMLEIIKANEYRGDSLSDLLKASKPFIGKTAKYFEAAVNHPNFEDFKEKYAACVPHVMIYPASGVVKPTKVGGVIIR